ncbi:MAG: cupin domain-containing protein [Acidobacteriaceae bacterium]
MKKQDGLATAGATAESDERLHENQPDPDRPDLLSRRAFMGTAAMAGATLLSGAAALGQTRQEKELGLTGDYASDPGPENKTLLELNPDSNLPPFTDRGNPAPFWYSFDLTPKRVQGGGWTHQVTQREIGQSRDLAGVNMRLTAGSFRELHWHLADEWAIMLTGKARVSIMQPDGKMFIDDVERGDLWYFPAGYPHSIQGLEGPGCEFLLVFDQGDFSEDDTFLLSETLAHIPPEVIQKNMGWNRQEWNQLPATELYIFPADLPGPLEDDKRFLGSRLETVNQYTFHGAMTMKPNAETTGGSARIIDSTNFTVSKHVATGIVTVRPGGLRELHWHPNGSEWQYWIQGKGRMTVTYTGAKARTMDFNAGDVGFVPTMAAHYIENTGSEDLIFLEMFRTSQYQSISLNEWISRMPDKMAQAHLKLPISTIRRAPGRQYVVLPK